MDLSLKQLLCIGYGVLTVEDEAQALARALISEGDKGGKVAKVCLDMIALRKSLLSGAI
jgi:6,7-dimethyl-8-ribityllumazine synthase